MRLELLRLNARVSIGPGVPSTLEIHDRALFAKVCRSLISERGQYAEEPYVLMTEDGKAVSARKSMLVVSALPNLPLRDRTLISKLYQQIAMQAELNSEKYELVNELACRLSEELETVTDGMWGEYSFAGEWSIGAYCKAMSFLPVTDDSHSLIENCIALLGLCADIGFECPIVMVNAKSFLVTEEIEELFEQVFFLDSRLLLLESWQDNRVLAREEKTIVDLHFLVE